MCVFATRNNWSTQRRSIKFTGSEPTAFVFESDGGIGGSQESGETKIWSLQGAETSPREESPVLMSSGEQRLIRTNGVKEVGGTVVCWV